MCCTMSGMKNRFCYHLWIFILWFTEWITELGIHLQRWERISQCMSVGVRGLSKREEGGRRVKQEKEEEGTERQESQGSSGWEDNEKAGGKWEKQSRRKARWEVTAPGLWVKVQVAKPNRNRDQKIFATLCLGSNHSNRKPCPALESSV